MKKLLIPILCLIFAIPSAEAQFLKNLKKKVQQKVENTVTDNISDKAAAEADNSLNKMWEMNADQMSFPMGSERVDPSLIPDTYNFDWEYTLSMETAEGDMDMTYHLKENAPYFGIRMPQSPQMFMVMDTEKDLMLMFLDSEGNKMLTGTKLNTEALNDSELDNPYEDAEIKQIGTKEILGYSCQGYQTETEEYVFDFYITDEAEISFNEIYKANQKQAPKGFNPDWLKEGTGLMMHMEMKDKKDPAKNMTMTCTNLEKKDFAISKAGYQSF